MKRRIILVAFLLVVLAISIVVLVKGKKENQVCFQNHCFGVELAKTAKEKSRGLMFRKSLDSDKGMFFIFEKEENYSFWMANTLIPLDIIWLNANKDVVFISDNAQPCEKDYPCLLINPYKNAKYVLEVNGGVAKKIGLKTGDKANLSRFLVE